MENVEKFRELVLNNENAKTELKEILIKQKEKVTNAIIALAKKHNIVLTSKDLDYGSNELSEEELTSIAGGTTAWISFKPFEENYVILKKY